LLSAAAGAAIHLAGHLGADLPEMGLPRAVGGLLLMAVLLAVLEAAGMAMGLTSESDLAGAGGGYAGGLILGGLVAALGNAGTAVVLLGVTLAGAALVAGLSPSELFAEGGRRAEEMAAKVRRERPAGDRSDRTRRAMPPSSITPAPPQEQPVAASSPSARFEGETRPASESTPAKSAWEEAVPQPASPVWSLPSLDSTLDQGAAVRADDQLDRQRGRLIEDTLMAFGAPVRVVEINRGPTITQFGVEPDYTEGRGGRRTKVKVSKITALADDLALALAAPSVRIQAPVPGKGYVGIEVPNAQIQVVALRDVMEAAPFRKLDSRLRLALGQDVSGRAVAADLAAMPHLLIAGTTGSGKSVCVNAIISCLLLQNTPDDLRFVMVDPKRVELAPYNRVPHLLAPVVVELDRVVGALQWISREMNDRYKRFSQTGVRNIEEYNRRMEASGERRLPYLVLVIDELADLMMLAPDETEKAITRLAQLARATGIHLIIATQRPSVDVVTGLIKANFPARIAFAVASSVDSRVVLDQPGAERLLGRGDMLFQAPDSPAPVRMQGAFVSEPELARLIDHWKSQAVERGVVTPPLAPSALPTGVPLKQGALWETMGPEDGDTDPLFDEAVEIVRRMRRASISLLQRRLRIGYTRSARMVDQLEEKGIVGPAQSGSQAREVLDFGEFETEGESRPSA
jgi:S-DNA-T family DNA segregation ATPase FtsK/SpoIIIE